MCKLAPWSAHQPACFLGGHGPSHILPSRIHYLLYQVRTRPCMDLVLGRHHTAQAALKYEISIHFAVHIVVSLCGRWCSVEPRPICGNSTFSSTYLRVVAILGQSRSAFRAGVLCVESPTADPIVFSKPRSQYLLFTGITEVCRHGGGVIIT